MFLKIIYNEYTTSMKPKNRVHCIGAGKSKILFADKKAADRYMQFNADEVRHQSGYAPTRSYECELCGGWHVTSAYDETKPFLQEELIRDYINKPVEHVPSVKTETSISETVVTEGSRKDQMNKKQEKYREQISHMNNEQARTFLVRQMINLKEQLHILNYTSSDMTEEKNEILQEINALRDFIKKFELKIETEVVEHRPGFRK